MPSQMLTDLSNQIESQDTDDFGKFYMYAALLNMITRRQNLAFSDVLPQHSGLIGKTPIHNGNKLPATFFASTKQYQKKFEVPVPDLTIAMHKVVLSYFRTGQLSDLIYIIKQMTSHLSAMPQGVRQNQSTYNSISFGSHHNDIQSVLLAVSNITDHAQSIVDNSMHTFMATSASVVFLMAALTASMSVGGVFIALLLSAASGYSAYLFFHQAVASFASIENSVQACARSVKVLVDIKLNSFYRPNFDEFILATVLAPLTYTQITVKEQMSVDKFMLDTVKDERRSTDTVFSNLGIR